MSAKLLSTVLRAKSNSKRAFNLLEVVIAGFIFSTVSVAFLGVWGMQARALEKSRHSLLATKIAEHLVEDAMEKGFERMSVTRERDEDEADDEPETSTLPMTMELRGAAGEWNEIEIRYRTSVSVVETGVEEVDKLKKVTVTVNWDDSTKVGEVKLVTFLAGVF